MYPNKLGGIAAQKESKHFVFQLQTLMSSLHSNPNQNWERNPNNSDMFLSLKVISETSLEASVFTCMFKIWEMFCIWDLQHLF